MSQRKVWGLLSKHPNELFTSSEISQKVGVDKGRVTQNLRHLKKFFPIFMFTRGSEKNVFYAFCEHFKIKKIREHNIYNHTTMERIVNLR